MFAGLPAKLSLALVAAIGLMASPQARAVEFFALSQPELAIYRLDSETLGNPELIGDLPSESDPVELIDAGDGTLLTFDRTSNSMFIFTIAEGRVTDTVKLDRDIDVNVRGFSRDSRGQIYGVFPGMTLMKIDRATGETTVVANLHGAARVEAIAFGPGDRLFAIGSEGRDTKSEKLYRMDKASGKLTLIGPTGFADTDTLTYGRDTYLYGANSRVGVPNELQRISPRDGKGVTLGNAGVAGFNGIVLGPKSTASKRSNGELRSTE
jgi:hypothetical protein